MTMDRVGQQFGDYRLIRLIGQGGFADVYLGEHSRRKTLAAIKVLHTRLANDNIKAFLNEARSFRLRHPHIVQILDFGLEDDFPFLVMEYASNGSLRQRHSRGTQISLETICLYVKQIAQALQYAHDEGIVHRDIKPDNMLLGRQNEVLLSDFGIASLVHTTYSSGLQDQAGTITYMAPEQLRGKPRPASDQYSLGVVVYEWICGKRPFQGSFVEIHSQHLSVPPPSLRECVPTLSSTVEEVVMTVLAKDPHSRFADVSAFANALERACKLVPPSLTATNLQVEVHVPETSNVMSPLNNPRDQPPVIIQSLNDPIQSQTLEQSSSIRGQVPDKDAGATESEDSLSKEAGLTGEGKRPVDAPLSSLPEVFDNFPANNLPMLTETKSYESSQTIPESGTRPDGVEPSSATPKNIGYVHRTEPETSSTKGPVISGKSKRSAPFQRNGAGVGATMATRAAGGSGIPPSGSSPGGLGSGGVGGSRRRRQLLAILLILLTLLLIGGIAAAAIPGGLGSITHIIPGVSTTAVMTITPKNQLVPNTFAIVAVTSAPDANKRQVAARMLTATSQSQSKTVQSTGSIPGARATGALTFLNSTGSNLSFGSVILRGSSGVAVSFNGPITVSASSGFLTVTGYAVNVGSAGNIPALDISGSCCAAGITVKNGAFGGGQDPLPNSIVQQSDINGAADALTPGTQSDLQKQVKANEQVVPNSFKCNKSTFNADHRAGDRAPDVTVTVAVTCTEEVYDQQAATAMAEDLLKTQASKDPGPAYALTGVVVTGVTKASVLDAKGTVSLLVSAQGVWVYQFSDAVKQDFANHIANKSEQDAKTYLLGQTGVSDVKIVISSGTNLPDASHITIEIAAIPGATGTPTT